MADTVRTVGSHIVLSADSPFDLHLQVAVFDASRADERLQITCAGRAIEPTEIVVEGRTRVHVCRVPAGPVEIDYRATVTGRSAPRPVTEAERVVYLRPSRYAESDRLTPLARAEFAGITDPSRLLTAVSSWVGSRLQYEPGSSLPTDGAIDTLLSRRGVCRDYAHLVIALLRALDVPARLAAVYAPGLEPMDFHAVAEAAISDTWQVVDATLLAPRSGLVRICADRDAADTAFISTYGAPAELVELAVWATIDGDLPADDVTEFVQIT